MDVDALYKQLKAEAVALVEREKELDRKIEEVKRLKDQNQSRKVKIAKLEAELARLIASIKK